MNNSNRPLTCDLHIASTTGFLVLKNQPYTKELVKKINYLAGLGLTVTTTPTESRPLADMLAQLISPTV